MRKYIIIVPFLLAVLLTHPFGDIFYGQDDWAYAWPIINFLKSGKIVLSTQASALAIPQILFASLVSRLFGFSLRTINFSMIIIGLAGIIVAYKLMKELGLKERNAAVGAAFMGITPLYIGFSASFMTDMPYTFLVLAACLEYVRGLNQRKIMYLFFASILSAAAFLNRQVGFILFAVFILTVLLLVYQKKIKAKEGVYFSLAGGTLPILVFIIHFLSPEVFGGRTVTNQGVEFYKPIIDCVINLRRSFANFFRFWNYAAILLLPLWLAVFWQARKKLGGILKFYFKAAAIFASIYLIFSFSFIIPKKQLYISGDFLHVGFILSELINLKGQVLLWDVLVLFSSITTTVLFCLIIEYLKTHSFKKIVSSSNYPGWIFLALLLFIQVVLTCVYPGFSNNYFLPLLCLIVPFLVLLADYFCEKFYSFITLSLVILGVIISVLVIEPYRSFSQASWKEADRLVQSGVDSRKIYAPVSWYVWNNYYFFEKKDKGVLDFIKYNSNYLISELKYAELKLRFADLKMERTVYYDTFLGKRSLYVYSYEKNR